MTPQQARQVLNAPIDSSAEDVARAFRRAVKAAHPDLGGSAERLRLVIEANELLKRTPDRPRPTRPAGSANASPERAFPDQLEITVEEALLGGRRRLETAGGPLDLVLPPGLRSGETLRTKGPDGRDLLLRVGIRDGCGMSVRGDDLWVQTPAQARGARLEVDTPRGRRSFWLSRKVGSKRLLKLSGEGLPARGGRPAGDLIVRLDAPASPADSPARQMLRRFAGTWAVA